MNNKIVALSVISLMMGVGFISAQTITPKIVTTKTVATKVDRVQGISNNLSAILDSTHFISYNYVTPLKNRVKSAVLAKKNVTDINNIMIEIDANLVDANSNILYAGKLMKGITKETASNASILTTAETSINQAKVDLGIIKRNLPIVDDKLKKMGF